MINVVNLAAIGVATTYFINRADKVKIHETETCGHLPLSDSKNIKI